MKCQTRLHGYYTSATTVKHRKQYPTLIYCHTAKHHRNDHAALSAQAPQDDCKVRFHPLMVSLSNHQLP